MAGSAWALVVARIVQGLGAVSGPVMAFLADLTRPESRTRAMFAIGMSIGVSFVISLVAGPLLAAAIGVSGVFRADRRTRPRRPRARAVRAACRAAAAPAAGARDCSQVLTRQLLPHYAGIFMLHLTLTAAFIAVPHVLRDLHGIDGLAPLARVSRRLCGLDRADRAARALVGAQPQPGSRGLVGGVALAAALAALGLGAGATSMRLLAALVLYFGAFNFLEARLPAALTEAAGEESRGAALGVFATCQFAGAFAGGLMGGALLGSHWQRHGNLRLCGRGGRLAWLPLASGIRNRGNPARLTVRAAAGGRLQ